jgi:multidrug efflux system outer membrane protein
VRADTRRRRRAGWVAAAALAAGACSVAPPYRVPALPVPAAYKEAAGWQPAGSAATPTGDWWLAFGDPVLSDLETRIERGNYTLAEAVARYDQARGTLRQTRGALLPEVDLGAAASRTRVSADRPLTSGSASTYTVGQVGPSLAYEIDLFGRVRNSVRAAASAAQASAADVAAIRLGLQAQLATTYFDMRGLDARIVLLRQTVDAYTRANDLTNTRHGGGIASGIDVSRSQAQLSSARAELSAVATARENDEHAIAVLIGEAPAGFAIAVVDRQTQPPVIPAGLPSTLLERRPDIAAAERRVAAANARIGVARAALFPSITLGASGGFQAASGSLLSAAAGYWALGPLNVAQAIFDGGRRRGGVDVARGQFEEAAADYRQTVLTAFREVEDDLGAQRNLAAQERDQAVAAAAAERTRDLALIRYRDGAADYLEVVTAQTAALDAERALLQVRSSQLQTATDTIRALGGRF